MSRIKMVLMLVLLLATVVTAATTMFPRGGTVARASCPAVGEMQGTCETNQADPNFSSCRGGGDPHATYINTCSQLDCSYRDPYGNEVSGTCCQGGACEKYD